MVHWTKLGQEVGDWDVHPRPREKFWIRTVSRGWRRLPVDPAPAGGRGLIRV